MSLACLFPERANARDFGQHVTGIQITWKFPTFLSLKVGRLLGEIFEYRARAWLVEQGQCSVQDSCLQARIVRRTEGTS